MTCVGNDDDLRSVAYGADGVLAGLAEGAIFVDHTTASADVARELFAACRQQGAHFIDAPVSGGQAGAENGTLTIMCGGEPDPFARAEPVLRAYGRAVTLMGPAGAGQLTKMVNQICIGGLLQALAEGVNFAAAGRPRPGSGAGHDLQGCRPVLADGQSLADHGRRQVRLRLRRRLDAQGSRRSRSTRADAMARRCRSRRWSTSSIGWCSSAAAAASTLRA